MLTIGILMKYLEHLYPKRNIYQVLSSRPFIVIETKPYSYNELIFSGENYPSGRIVWDGLFELR